MNAERVCVDLLLSELAADGVLSGDLSRDVAAFFVHHDARHVLGHCARVGAEARRLAVHFGADPQAAEAGGLLHDISVVIPNEQRIHYAEQWGIEVLPEERLVPMIIHQKLSAYIAKHLFGIDDRAVLSAIGCHTTLKAGATPLDKVVFLADKLRWDGAGDPPYLDALEHEVARSLDGAAAWFVEYLWQRRDSLLVIHPLLAAAHADNASTPRQ